MHIFILCKLNFYLASFQFICEINKKKAFLITLIGKWESNPELVLKSSKEPLIYDEIAANKNLKP